MKPWKGGTPESIPDLMTFYHQYVKLVYSLVQSDGVLPQEMLFEVNAAFDHLSRHWTHAEAEEVVVQKAYGHLKRCCLDGFKIRFRDCSDHRRELRRLDTTGLDNGSFTPRMHRAWAALRKQAAEARQMEGRPDLEGRILAFDGWEEVVAACEVFDETFYEHERLSWVRRRSGWRVARQVLVTLVLGAMGSLLAASIADPGSIGWMPLGVVSAASVAVVVWMFRSD